jgi:hypothetical protein
MKTAIIQLDIENISDEVGDRVTIMLGEKWKVEADDVIGFEDGNIYAKDCYVEVRGTSTKGSIAEELQKDIAEVATNEDLRVVVQVAFIDENEIFIFE